MISVLQEQPTSSAPPHPPLPILTLGLGARCAEGDGTLPALGKQPSPQATHPRCKEWQPLPLAVGPPQTGQSGGGLEPRRLPPDRWGRSWQITAVQGRRRWHRGGTANDRGRPPGAQVPTWCSLPGARGCPGHWGHLSEQPYILESGDGRQL